MTRARDRTSSATTRDRGFSLVELMFALAILSIGVLGMASMMVAAVRSEIRATARIELTEVIQNKLEELRAVAAAGTSDTVQLNIGGTLGTAVANHVDTISSSAGRWYVRTWEVSAGPGGSRTVTVRGAPRDVLVFTAPVIDIATHIVLN